MDGTPKMFELFCASVQRTSSIAKDREFDFPSLTYVPQNGIEEFLLPLPKQNHCRPRGRSLGTTNGDRNP